MKYIKLFEYFEKKEFTLQDLKELLSKYNIPLNKYGTEGYKTISHLYTEIITGECSLKEVGDELHREVNFIGAKVIYKKDGVNYRLWEDRAVFKDGRIRVRNIEHSMAEKMKAGEDPKEALIRGMKEELNMDINENQITYYNKKKIEDNTDYPGIHSYHTGLFYLIVINDNQFKKEYIEHQSDKDIYFKWRKMEKKIAGHYPLPLGKDTAFEKLCLDKLLEATTSGDDEYFEWKGLLSFKKCIRDLREELFFVIERGPIAGYDLISTLNGAKVSINLIEFTTDYVCVDLEGFKTETAYNKNELIIYLIQGFKYKTPEKDKILDKSPYMFDILERFLPKPLKDKYAYLKNELF